MDATRWAMAEAAAARGLAYLAITDHSKGLKIAGCMAELARQGNEIRGLNDELGASHSGSRILRGVEMNLAPSEGTSNRFLGCLSVLQALWNVLLRAA